MGSGIRSVREFFGEMGLHENSSEKVLGEIEIETRELEIEREREGSQGEGRV